MVELLCDARETGKRRHGGAAEQSVMIPAAIRVAFAATCSENTNRGHLTTGPQRSDDAALGIGGFPVLNLSSAPLARAAIVTLAGSEQGPSHHSRTGCRKRQPFGQFQGGHNGRKHLIAAAITVMAFPSHATPVTFSQRRNLF